MHTKFSSKRPLLRLRRRWKDNIKIDLRESVEGFGLDSSGSEYGLVAGPSEDSNVPSCFVIRIKISWLAERLLVCQEGLRSMELVIQNDNA
jgi:hypothetical protein